MQEETEYVGFIVPQRLYQATRGGAGIESTELWKAHPPPSLDFKVGGRLGVNMKAASEGIYVPIVPLSDSCATQWASRVGHALRIEVRIQSYILFSFAPDHHC